MSEEQYPRLNLDLKAEVEYMCVLANAVKYGRPHDRQLARQINEWGLTHKLAEGTYMSEEGFSGIMREGSEPRVETLRKATRYIRTLEASYSIGRLFRAAGWYDDDDPEVDPERTGPKLSPEQARLCALVPQLRDEEAANLADNAEMLIAYRQRAAP